MGSLLVNTTDAWVRWNLVTGIASIPRNKATERGTIENWGNLSPK